MLAKFQKTTTYFSTICFEFQQSIFTSSYHQKYRLQGHKDLAQSLGLNSKLLQTSHVAARLNGYLVGVGGVKQFEKEANSLGLTPDQIKYVETYCRKHEGSGLFC